MPLYRYECESCGSKFTVLARQQALEDVPVCPECGSQDTRRMVPRVAIQFKGSGYYKTDYARKGRGDSSNNRTSAKNSNTSTESKSSDTPNTEKSTGESVSKKAESAHSSEGSSTSKTASDN